jgi:hypothetical protein
MRFSPAPGQAVEIDRVGDLQAVMMGQAGQGEDVSVLCNLPAEHQA